MIKKNQAGSFFISKEKVDAFLDFSGDHNLLHHDEKYAARTPYGKIVIPGVSIILLALSKIYQNQKGILHSIEAEFKKPLFLNESYLFHFENQYPRMKVWIKSKTESLSKITWMESSSADTNVEVSKNSEESLERLQENKEYTPNLNAFNKLNELYGLQNIDKKQIFALSWCSYFVGMVYPGKQALFSKLKLVFEKSNSDNSLTFGPLFKSFDDRFSLAKIYGTGNFVKHIELAAFERPQPIQFHYNDIEKAMSGISLKGEKLNSVVLGGSRGLGSVFVQSLSSLDSKVLFTYKDADDEALRLIKEVEEKKKNVVSLKCDLKSISTEVLGDKIKAIFDRIDILVLNASPQIWPSNFVDQTTADFLNFIQSSIQIISNSLHAIKPLLAENAVIIFPSSVYVDEKKEGYSHYVAAKSAIEGILNVLSKEWTTQRFITLKTPRILTDQTNTPFSIEESLNPMDIVRQVLKVMARNEWKENHIQIFFEKK